MRRAAVMNKEAQKKAQPVKKNGHDETGFATHKSQHCAKGYVELMVRSAQRTKERHSRISQKSWYRYSG